MVARNCVRKRADEKATEEVAGAPALGTGGYRRCTPTVEPALETREMGKFPRYMGNAVARDTAALVGAEGGPVAPPQDTSEGTA